MWFLTRSIGDVPIGHGPSQCQESPAALLHMAHNAHPAEAPGGDKIDEYVLEDILEDLQHFAATQIQRVFRGYLGRRHIAAVVSALQSVAAATEVV